MTFREVIAQLKRWFDKLNLALWLHHREFDGSRRAALFGAAALVASAALAEVPGYRTLAQLGRVPAAGPLAAELTEVVRRAFMPRVYVQLWKTVPLLAALQEQAT